ncbi:MAG: SCP2 sterol-binding domain-containing protein, partial [Burkholderiales bacterium]|nr:SCP2 sterol-binding domain-containing protein [Burkholderiales bacterium]
GDEAIAFKANRKVHVRDIVKPLRARRESVYVVPGSDAEAHVAATFPHKNVRRIGSGRSFDSVRGFIRMAPLVFQRGRSMAINARYHFRFRGREAAEATIDIRNQRIKVEAGLVGKADLTVTTDSDAWLGLLGKDRHLIWELLRGGVRLKGSPKLLKNFMKCFPS